MIMIVGFALAGTNIFGQENDDYIDEFKSIITLFLMILGEYDFDKMYRVNPFSAYIFFIVYQAFIFLVMVNIFLAILNDAYLAIKEQFDKEPIEERAAPLTIRQRLLRVRAWIRQRHLDKRIETLRKQQRKRELAERRTARKLDEARNKTLMGMGGDRATMEARCCSRGS